jgi:hypothetical protein
MSNLAKIERQVMSLAPEGIEIAKQRDQELSSGSVKPISHSEFLRRISSNE